jgi:hypothetical protein
VVALDVLDQTVERYMQTWYRALSATYRRRATLVGNARFDAGLTGADGSTRKGYSVLRQQLPNYLR